LEFAQTEIKNQGENFSFKTSMGFLPFPTQDKFLAENLEGLKLLAQQFGIMEEEFYEAVMEFNPS
jgi:UDP-N-acetylmuramate: L-alanyl-gamma-D-glutamyl-meso-diaminopimelate ligase